ncbi:MAG TPA: hypothetical protein VM737_05715 [Gemmatimonadota bacterium]|nr:hypothetical protein [Gemmatimonadota bacterium]
MPNFDLSALQKRYAARNMRVLVSRLLKDHPEYKRNTIVTYQVRDTGDTRLQVCTSRDEVRQVFLSPHCEEARTLRAADPDETSDAA